MKTTLLPLFGCSLFAGCAGLLVAPASPAALPTHAEIRSAFDALDTSRNGAVSFTEWGAAGDMLFWRLDVNGDGVLFPNEVGDSALMLEMFPKADQTRDGRLSRAEFGRLRGLIFQIADVDHNDYIAFAEYELLVLLRRSGWEDKSGYGRILPSKLRALLKRSFPPLDVNGDGVLTGDEAGFFAAAHRKAMDPKGTGRITLDQIYKAYRWLVGFDMRNHNL